MRYVYSATPPSAPYRVVTTGIMAIIDVNPNAARRLATQGSAEWTRFYLQDAWEKNARANAASLTDLDPAADPVFTLGAGKLKKVDLGGKMWAVHFFPFTIYGTP